MRIKGFRYWALIVVGALLVVPAWTTRNCGISMPLAYLLLFKLAWCSTESELSRVLEQQDVEVPFCRDPNGLIIVEARIDAGKKEKFLFDTGMAYLCVSNAARRHLITLPGLKATSPAGKEFPCGLLKAISIDRLNFKLPFAVSFAPSKYVKDPEIAGILGSALFAQFEVTIDNRLNVIRFRSAKRDRSQYWTSFRSKENYAPFLGPNVLVTGKFQGQDAEFYLDSGFNSNLIPPFSAYLVGEVKPFEGVKCEWYKDAQIGVFRAGSISVGDVIVNNVVFYVVLPDRDWASTVPLDKQIVLGNWFLRRLEVVTIDYANKKITFVE